MSGKVCPECGGNMFNEDKIHSEVCCLQCGLVLIAPPSFGLVFPGFVVVPHHRNLRLKLDYFDKSIYLSVGFDFSKDDFLV